MSIPSSKHPWLVLRLVPEISRVRFYTLIDHFQSPAAVFGASAKEIAALRGFDESLARVVLDAPQAVPLQKELDLMEKHGARLLTLDDEEYPDNLRQSSFPPPILFVRGNLESSDRYSLAIVGSRHATQYGKAVARQFASRLTACGITIISGFARGIDSQAHEAAIEGGGRTIGVLGSGLSVCYPAENKVLGERITERGALVTEYPMETPPDRFNFPERNHILAAMSLGTIVVEAAEKSGALITAREAADENRFVFAVPGDINRMNSRGANGLIQAGARLVQRAEDVLSEMQAVLRGYLREEDFLGDLAEGENTKDEKAANKSATRKPKIARRTPPALSDEEKAVYEILQHEPHYFDALLARITPANIPQQRLSTLLLNLELKQVIKQLPGQLYIVLE